MAESVTLPVETTQQMERLGSVDFAVGVASEDQAGTIAHVVQAAWTGLVQTFPGARVAVIHVDAGSRDGTAERVQATIPADFLLQTSIAPNGAARLAAPPPVANTRALQMIFALASSLGARGCAVLGADITNISPDWVARLLSPVADDRADYVAPYFARHRFAGAITTGVVYPFVRALYGRRIRYPMAGEFACSTRLLQHYLAAPVWRSELTRLGIEAWLTTQAMVGEFRIIQADLGVRAQSESAGDLSGTLTRVLGALFLDAERSALLWQKVRGSQPVPIERATEKAVIEDVAVDQQRSVEAFRLGVQNLTEVWAPVLPPLTLLELRRLARLGDTQFRMPDALWARMVYDFALAYRTRALNRDHLLAAFIPLYSGWLGSFIGELQAASEPEVEARIEHLCLQYEAEKPYLISRWRWPDRFNP
jgi:hypothetical protein